MFGIYRWLLACIVIMAHLGPMEAISAGFYSVFGFYTLSGYLMSRVICESYRQMPYGIWRYLLNRFLRIFPAYWAALILAACIAWLYPAQARAVHPLFGMPADLPDWLGHITLTGVLDLHGQRPETLLIPPIWSLYVECFYYLLLPVMLWYRLAKTFFITLIAGYPFIAPGNILALYYSPFAGGLPFILGLTLYFIGSKNIWRVPLWVVSIALAFLVWLMIPSDAMYAIPLQGRLYLSLICNGIIVLFLSGISLTALDKRLRTLDTRLGEITYALFLVHVSVGALCYALLATWLQPDSLLLYCIAFIPVHGAAWLLFWTIERPINRIRRKVKTSGATP